MLTATFQWSPAKQL